MQKGSILMSVEREVPSGILYIHSHFPISENEDITLVDLYSIF